MTGRTLPKWARVYMSGIDLSGMGRDVGPLVWQCDEADLTAQMNDAAKGSLPNLITVSPGTYNGVLQSTTDTGIEVSAIQTAGVGRDIMIPIGDRAAPAFNDPVFCCKASHNGLHVVESGGAITITAEFGSYDASDVVGGVLPWGKLIHINEAETAVNSSTTDTLDIGAAGATYGYFAWQIFSGDIAGTIKVQHSDANTDVSFVDLTGCSATIAVPGAGMALATISPKQYIRWQITISSGTTLTFAMAFVHNGVQSSVAA
jgi:hypothetical protein